MTARLVPALIFALGAGAAGAADIGRLFFSPEQRAAYDIARRQNIRREVVREEPARPVSQDLSVSGVVRRSDGKSTIWLNNRIVDERGADGINVAPGRTDDTVKLTLPESGRTVDVKVGQRLEPDSGTIQENYARRTLPPKPEAKATPDPKNSGPEVAKVTPPAGSQPVESSGARSDKARETEGKIQNETVPKGGAERKQ